MLEGLLALKSSGEVDVEEALGDTRAVVLVVTCILAAGLVDSIRVEGDVVGDVVEEESLQVFLAELAEQESIDSWAEFLEGEV